MPWGLAGPVYASSLNDGTSRLRVPHLSRSLRKVGFNLTPRTVTDTLDAKTFGANRLKFTPDGKLVLISSLGEGDLVIYDAASRKQFKRVKIGHGAAGILMDDEGNRVFIACTPDNYVA